MQEAFTILLGSTIGRNQQSLEQQSLFHTFIALYRKESDKPSRVLFWTSIKKILQEATEEQRKII